jgi:hypothetical protein
MSRQTLPRRDSKERLYLQLAAAKLRADNHSNEAIGLRLKLSPTSVWKLLDEGMNANVPLLIRRVDLNPNAYEPADLDEACNRYLADDKELTQSLMDSRKDKDKRFLRIVVLPDGQDTFAAGAARYISQLLMQSTYLGLMYGRALEKVVVYICKNRPEDAPQMERLCCIPLSGTPVHLIDLPSQRYTSSHLAEKLQNSLNPGGNPQVHLPSLEAVPAYVARRYRRPIADDESTASRRRNPKARPANRPAPHDRKAPLGVMHNVKSMPGYQAVFNRRKTSGNQGLIMRTDTLITGVGIFASQSFSDPYATGAFIRERVHAEVGTKGLANQSRIQKKIERWSRIFLGDIGGLLVARPDREEADSHQKLIRSLNGGWTGINASDLDRIASGATKDGPPGVIVISLGDPANPAISAAKAQIIKEGIRLGYINHVFCSTAIANYLRQP